MSRPDWRVTVYDTNERMEERDLHNYKQKVIGDGYVSHFHYAES